MEGFRDRSDPVPPWFTASSKRRHSNLLLFRQFPAKNGLHRTTDALIQIAEVPGRGIPGKVREVRNGQVIVEFVNPSPVIKPGLTAQVVIKLT